MLAINGNESRGRDPQWGLNTWLRVSSYLSIMGRQWKVASMLCHQSIGHFEQTAEPWCYFLENFTEYKLPFFISSQKWLENQILIFHGIISFLFLFLGWSDICYTEGHEIAATIGVNVYIAWWHSGSASTLNCLICNEYIFVKCVLIFAPVLSWTICTDSPRKKEKGPHCGVLWLTAVCYKL